MPSATGLTTTAEASPPTSAEMPSPSRPKTTAHPATPEREAHRDAHDADDERLGEHGVAQLPAARAERGEQAKLTGPLGYGDGKAVVDERHARHDHDDGENGGDLVERVPDGGVGGRAHPADEGGVDRGAAVDVARPHVDDVVGEALGVGRVLRAEEHGGPGGVGGVGHDALEGCPVVVDVGGVARHRERGGVAVAAIEAHDRAAQPSEVGLVRLALRRLVDVVAAQARHGDARAVGKVRDRARAEVERDLAAQLDGPPSVVVRPQGASSVFCR